MAGCKGGKNIVKIRRSRTKRHQTLNPYEWTHRISKSMARCFSCFVDLTMMVHISTSRLQLEVVGPVIAHSSAVWARCCLATSRNEAFLNLLSLQIQGAHREMFWHYSSMRWMCFHMCDHYLSNNTFNDEQPVDERIKHVISEFHY